MPIKPENKARYPKDWPEIRERIMKRARNTCEHEGCTARHLEVGFWLDGKWSRMGHALREAGHKAGDSVACAEGFDIKLIMIVQTIAHLDHTPEHCDDNNFRAWCQRHHLAYDAEHHKQTAYATRRARANTLELPL